jgi:hypothetical protein
MDAANRLNRRVVRFVGKAEARRLARAIGVGAAGSLAEFLDFVNAGRELYVTDEALEMDLESVDDRHYSVSVGNCFVADNVRAAGVSEAYECAVFDRLHGWHDALGLPLTDDLLPAEKCLRAEGWACVRVLEAIPGVKASGMRR